MCIRDSYDAGSNYGTEREKYCDYLYHLRLGLLFPNGQITGFIHPGGGIRTVLKGVRTQSVYHLL